MLAFLADAAAAAAGGDGEARLHRRFVVPISRFIPLR
jgi:hypothetical protein